MSKTTPLGETSRGRLAMLATWQTMDDDDIVPPVSPDDYRTIELRAAVWEDPLSDDLRLVYADYLQDRGDPRGELVSLQVARAASGDPVSDRERTLVRRIGFECAQPLAPYLASDFQLSRGFVAKCTVNDTPMPLELKWSPAWRTVDDLSTTSYDLLVNPHVRAKRVGVSGRELVRLLDHTRLPFETVVGIAPVDKSQRGVWLDEDGCRRVANIGSLADLRVLSVNPAAGPQLIPILLGSPLGRQLRQLDAFVDINAIDAVRLRDAFDHARVPLLTLRFIPNTPAYGRGVHFGPEVLVGLRRTTRLPQIIVQVADVLDAERVTNTMRLIAQIARNVQYAELHDFGALATGISARHPVLLERLEAVFPQLLVHPPSAQPLSP